jgi:threonine aldolase
MICYENAHVYLYEGGGAAANAGVTARRIAGNRGILSPEAVASQINVDDPHFPHTSLVCIENTVNKGGGACWSLQEIRRVHDLCSEKGLALHMDGARLFNAVVAKGYQPHEIGKWVDSVSICLSKGLGAPVGSVLAGRKDFIHHARRARKRFGGGMRQAGMIAAAGLYALEHHVDRLKEDHERAAILAQSLRSCAWVEKVVPAETNIVIVYPKQEVAEILSKLEENGVLAVPFGPDAIRFVVHLDVDDKMIEHVCQLLLTLA